MRLLLAALLICLVGCGGIIFRASEGTNTITTVTGFVSIVQLSTVVNNGTFVSVTLVTLLQSGTANTFTFCGNLVDQFPVNSSVSVNFISTPPCFTAQLIVSG